VLTISNFLPRYCTSEPTFNVAVDPAGGILLLNGVSSSTAINPLALNPGPYTLLYKFKPATACLDTFTASGQFQIIAKPQLTGLSDQTITLGESVQLSVSGAATYLWTPATALSATNIPNPLANPEETTVYTVEGKDETEFCADTASVTIRVFEPLFIPNVITLNGDGKNDTWNIKGLRSRTLNKIEIYDRWGHKVLEQTSYPSPWNGKVNDEVLPGTYFFHIDFEDDTDRKGILTILGDGK
jgi:gliding motility-associated-like protein